MVIEYLLGLDDARLDELEMNPKRLGGMILS